MLLPLKDLSNAIKILAADAVEMAKSGHPGMPLGMSDIMTVLAFEFLRFNPNDPSWFNRDRLILSNGHGSMLLYAFFYLAGYKDFSLSEIQNFRQLHSKAAGHPEHHIYEAIETTTGPLGQGFANAVGMAISQKKYQAQLGKNICDYKIYAMVGDGCLMEGISYEAASIAGHLVLDNLIVIFDDNNISIDGNTNLTVSENHLAKFKAMGFETESIDGHDFGQISRAFSRAERSDKPYFIACKTVIGAGVENKSGSEKSHGSPLGEDEIRYLKKNANFPQKPFEIEDDIVKIWRKSWERNNTIYNNWRKDFLNLDKARQKYIQENPKIQLLKNIEIPKLPEATRVSSGKILQIIAKNNNKVIFGSADLSISNNLFGPNNIPINSQDFSGNFIHYGIREHAMAAIMSGMALSKFLPIGGTFFVFSDYMRPAIRLAAIMKLKVIYVMTHDSIGVGEDGPTHQPIEHLASFRAMPNIKVFRPCDFVETLECYELALDYDGPSIIALSRQNVSQLRLTYEDENRTKNGAYIISDSKTNKPDIVIFASGSEVSVGCDVQKILEESNGFSVRVISVPCLENLIDSSGDYLKHLTFSSKLKVAIEAGVSFGWHKIIGENGMFFGLDQFGHSGPASVLYEYFGLTPQKIAQAILRHFS